MKKALVILILLAFVGGGLFAQTVNIQGQFETGIGVLVLEAEDDPTFGLHAPTSAANGVRTQLLFTYTNAEGNAGFLARFRGHPAPTWNRAYGWAKFMDGMVEARGGLWFTDLGTYDFSGDEYAKTGVMALIRPSDTITIGVGGYSGSNLPGAAYDDGGLGIWGGLGMNMPGLMGLRAQLAFEKDNIDALISANITALDAFPIIATAEFARLDDFADEGVLWTHVNVGLNIVEGLNLNLAGSFGMSMEDDSDPFIAGGAWMTFPMGNMVPGLHAYFVMGGEYSYTGYGLSPRLSTLYHPNMSFNKDHMYVSVTPNVQFRVNNNCMFDVGAVVNFDMGDDAAAGGDGLSFGAYAALRVNF